MIAKQVCLTILTRLLNKNVLLSVAETLSCEQMPSKLKKGISSPPYGKIAKPVPKEVFCCFLAYVCMPAYADT